jgi:hypothetical protein
MSDLCRHAGRCSVFTGSLDSVPHLAKRYRTHFCFGEWQECARFAVAEELGISGVPDELLPHQLERGYELISAGWSPRKDRSAAVFGGT